MPIKGLNKFFDVLWNGGLSSVMVRLLSPRYLSHLVY